MQTQTIRRGVAAAAAVIVAAAVVLLARGPSDAPTAVQLHESERVAPKDPPLTLAVADTPAPSQDALAAAKVRELEDMSETFRNSTFLIAIRDAGYNCNQLLRVFGGINDSMTWTATCSEMLAYTVRVAQAGVLHIEPTLDTLDSLPWSPQREPGGDTIEIAPPPRR